jgi:hypothetical protein
LSASRIEAARVPLVERVLRIGPGERPRAGEGGSKANPLLVAEGDNLNRVIEAFASPSQPVDHRERGKGAIISIIAHGVDVRAQHQGGRARAPALVSRHDIARGVDPRLEPRLAGPADESLGGAPMGV